MEGRDVGQPGLLAELQSGDPQRESAALRTLMRLLLAHAGRDLGARRDFVNAQADSVVQHAVARELAEGREASQRFENDEHLYGRLHLAVSHRIHEVLRSRKKNARHLAKDARGDGSGGDGAGRIPEPGTPMGSATAPSPGSTAAAISRSGAPRAAACGGVRRGPRARAPCRDRGPALRGCGTGSRDQRGQRANPNVAVRRRLRERLLQPVLERVGESDRSLVEALFVERVEFELLASSADAGRGEVAAVLTRRVSELVQAPFAESLGTEGVASLNRLLGRVRSPAGGARRRVP